MQIELGDIVNSFATLVAAFAGAWLAFVYQNRQKNNDEIRQNVSAGNRALVMLFQHVNSLKLYQIDVIEPYRDSPGRHMQIPPNLPFEKDALSFDIKSLDFLLSPDAVQVVFDLIVEEARYHEAIKTINARSQHHLTVVQPKLSSAGIVEGHVWSGQDFRNALGGLDYMHLKRLTDAVVLNVDRTVESLASMKSRLREALVGKYPKGNFINFDLLNEPPTSIFSQQPA